MKDKLKAAKQKLTVLSTNDAAFAAFTYFAGALTGSAVVATIVYYKTKHDYDNLLTLPLGKEAFEALVTGETDVVNFWTGKHEHVFRVTLES